MQHHLLGRGLAAVALVLSLAAGAADASADDAEAGFAQAAPTVSWGGVYVGGQLGWAWSDFDWTYKNPNYFNTLGATIVGTDFDQDANGVIGGGLLGWNYQSGPWVFGVEGSISAADLKDDQPSPFFPTLDVDTSEIDWLATATGRIGYAWDRWLVFGKGGYAGANVELTMNDATNQVRANSSTWANGWTVGAGAEYMIDHGLSLGLAYDYIDLDVDNETVTCPACGTGVGLGTPTVDGRIQIQSVMARLVFHFGP